MTKPPENLTFYKEDLEPKAGEVFRAKCARCGQSASKFTYDAGFLAIRCSSCNEPCVYIAVESKNVVVLTV